MSSSAIGATGAIAALPAGSMVDFAGTSAPGGWLMCDGSAISRTVYASLFAAVGTTYGSGDGSTTFNLPDFRGRFARYMDNMGTGAGAAGRDTGRALGVDQTQTTAKNGITLSNATVASSSHWHSLPVAVSFGSSTTSWETPPNGFNGTISGQTGTGSPMGTQMTRVAATNSKLTSYSDAATTTVGISGDTETRPINLSCNRIIKY